MQKSVLERFIAKYNLAGAAEAVTWNTKGNKLATSFISDDKNVLGQVTTTEVSFDDGEYSVYDTTTLRSLMGVLDEDIEIKVNMKAEKALSLQLKDSSSKVTFVLAKAEVIPDVPGLKQLPEFDLEVTLDERFFTTFVKGKNALPDVETFTVVTEKGQTSIVLGYSKKINQNQVDFVVDLAKGDGTTRPINFSARYMKEILLANKEARGGVLKISDKGLAHITFDLDGFSVDYYLVEIQTTS